MPFRCLVLWSHGTNLDDVLKLTKLILIPIDVLNALRPCPGKSHYPSLIFFHDIDIFYQLFSKNVILCVNNYVELPFSPSYSVPTFL